MRTAILLLDFLIYFTLAFFFLLPGSSGSRETGACGRGLVLTLAGSFSPVIILALALIGKNGYADKADN